MTTLSRPGARGFLSKSGFVQVLVTKAELLAPCFEPSYGGLRGSFLKRNTGREERPSCCRFGVKGQASNRRPMHAQSPQLSPSGWSSCTHKFRSASCSSC